MPKGPVLPREFEQPPFGPSITFAGLQRDLVANEPLTFGRGSTCDLRLPADPFISRLAGSVAAVDDYVLVRNLSESQSLILRPPVGEDRVIEPLAASTSLPFRVFQIVLTGQAGTEMSLQVRVGDGPRRGWSAEVSGTDGATVTRPVRLTTTQRRILGALCAPLRMRHGSDAAPATYQQIGEALQLSPQYVRKVVAELREALTGSGIPGLAPGDQTGPEDFRWTLSRLAIRNGWVDDLDD